MEYKCLCCGSKSSLYPVEIGVNHHVKNYSINQDKEFNDSTIWKDGKYQLFESERSVVTSVDLITSDEDEYLKLNIDEDEVFSYACNRCGYIMNFTQQIDEFEEEFDN